MTASSAGSVAAAVALLRPQLPGLGPLIDQYGLPRLGERRGTRFESLARSVCFQQLAGKAASAIWARTTAAVGPRFTPEAVLDAGPEALRAAGCSTAKATTIVALAQAVVNGQVRLDRLGGLDDAAVVDHLTQVRGIGPWTAHMFLLFRLGRLDVWPTGDLGVRQGFGLLHQLEPTPTPAQLDRLGEPYRPHRSVLAWYCWRAVDAQRAALRTRA